MEKNNRNLTDADVEAIATRLKEKAIKEFYADLGKGVWAMVWRAMVMAIVAVAAYGAMKDSQ